MSSKKGPGQHEPNISVRAKTENQMELIRAIRSSVITICTGPAGCGKTYVASAIALQMAMKKTGPINKIILVKSVTTLRDEEVGFLKGTLEEKMSPYMMSFLGNLSKMMDKYQLDLLKQDDTIEVLPIAFVRGMSIDNAIVLVDEAQNISISNMHSIMTRLGENSKMVIMGDLKQVDIKNKTVSSLGRIADKFDGVPGFSVVRFDQSDQVRNPLINVIEEKFDEIGEEARSAR